MRQSGILLHITSLPSPHGVGTLGSWAYRFVDFLSGAGQSYWQILPLGPTGYGDSPYQTFSAFAGNPYLIDLDFLAADGLLTAEEISSADTSGETVDFGRLYETRPALLKLACSRGFARDAQAVSRFAADNGGWLQSYALFMAVKEYFGGKPWYEWPDEIRLCRGRCAEYEALLRHEIDYHVYAQFLFNRQWTALKSYAAEKGIEFIGDVPIYVPLDSADVWANPQLFQLDADMRPREVAGVPPDAFTADGQLWGNPLYDWDAMARDGYRWWQNRLNAAAKLFDVVRIDHFRGLASYWAVPAGEKTAKNGKWRSGPGKPFISAVKNGCPSIRFIAEDLGYLTDDVRELLEFSGFPGMKILEFAFDCREPSNYLPDRYPENCICYTGTHDNETLIQWCEGLDAECDAYAREYLGISAADDLADALHQRFRRHPQLRSAHDSLYDRAQGKRHRDFL